MTHFYNAELVADRPRHSTHRHRYMVPMLVIIGASFVMRAHGLFVSNVDSDEGVYIIMGQRWDLGGLPYVAVWDQHPPGMAALFAIAQKLVPDPVLGARLCALFAVTTTALLIHRFCVRYVNQAGAGLIGALFYIVCISRWLGLAANTEVFNNACVTFASYLLYGASRQSPASLARPVAAAALLGIGLQIKYVVFPEAAILCLSYLAAAYSVNRDLRATVITAGVLILAGLFPTGVAVLYFWASGALQPFLDANIGSNIAYLDFIPTSTEIALNTATGLAPILGAILIIAYAALRGAKWHWAQMTTPMSPQQWVLIWTIAAVLDVCLPLKFFHHYYFALYPPISIAAGLALISLAQNRRRGLAAGLIILFATAVPYWVTGFARAVRSTEADAPRAIAAFIRETGESHPSVFVYDYQPVVYALARVRPPTPYVLGSELRTFTDSAHVDGSVEIQQVMDSSPDFTVVRVRPPYESRPVELDNIMQQRLAAYHLAREVVDGMDNAIIRIYRK